MKDPNEGEKLEEVTEETAQAEPPVAEEGRNPESVEPESDGNVAGDLSRSNPVRPESIDPENAFFVLVGALFVIVFLLLAIQGL